ncbi:alpha-1,2-mannosyltransferase [Amycolatopsis xylanica]|uniref:Alpha-1,2-mannosyltransferase n=1 Tax=Amycolatopsis xylanica TaxID=589385 RepID=A0A1H2UFS7_9PSEU|nr:alpha-1,2-mannosyltransferase [Amycolatopsis xylanica]
MLVVAAAAFGGVAVLWWLLGRPLGIDSAVYRAGGLAVLRGEPLYEHLSALPEWASGLPFTYTPFAAMLFTPLAALPIQLGWAVFAVAAAPAVFVTLRAFTIQKGLPLLVAGAFCLQPVWQTVGLGQINLILMAIVVVDVLVLRGSRYSGFGIGLAAAIKLIPLIFVVHLLVTGRRADAGRALAAFAGATLLGLAVLPGDSVRFWTSAIFNDHFAAMKSWVGNQSWQGFLARTLPGAQWAIVLGVALVGAATWFAVRRLHRAGDEHGALLVSAGCGLVVSPISWTHHWVWVVPAIGYLLTRRHTWMALATAVLFTGWATAIVPGGGGREQGWNLAQALFGNAYLLAALGAGAVLLVRHRSASRSPLRGLGVK